MSKCKAVLDCQRVKTLQVKSKNDTQREQNGKKAEKTETK